MSKFRPLAILVVLTLALLAVPVGTIQAQEATPEATPAPRFTTTVQVDGRRIGLTCEGSGSPTVVLIGGLRTPADEVWPQTVDAISPVTRVCVFERAGLGPSDPAAHVPQTAADVVADLHAALQTAGESGPYVPVGFSYGGLVARLFASTYPDTLAGLVLVEGAPPGWNVMDLTIGLFPDEAEREGLRELVAGRDPSLAAPVEEFVSEAQVLAAPPAPQVPTVEIVGGKAELAPEEGVTTWYELEGVARYFQLQAGQARDLGARIVVAPESGHFVPFDQPEVMIAAIKDVIAAVRDPSSWATPAAAS